MRKYIRVIAIAVFLGCVLYYIWNSGLFRQYGEEEVIVTWKGSEEVFSGALNDRVEAQEITYVDDNELFYSHKVIRGDTIFSIKGNKVSLSSNSNKLKDKKVLLSLYNGKSKLGGFKQQVYSSFEDVNYGLDFEDIKQGEYFLECYYSSNNSGSYQGEIYGTYGIALVVIDSKVCFVTDPTKKQIKQMIKAGGSSESDWIYTTKDGSELVLFAKGSKIYAYRKGKGTVLGLDLVGKIDGRSLGFQVEGLSGVLSYDTSAVSDGTYLLSVYEYQEDTRADQNYKSIAYSDQMLKVQVESGLVARILPPTRQEVAEVADTITDKSKTLYTSYMDSCRFQFYCQENTLYIYDVPQEYDYLQFILLDVNGRELDKGFYSGTAKAIEYSLDTYASGNYYINIYAYNREEGVFCSVLSGPSALPVLKSELGVELVEPRSYVKNVVGMEKSSRRLKGYLQEEINIETTDGNIVSLAESIVSDSDSDYEKAHKIHAWITENITYDEELADNPDVWYRTQRASAIDVLKERKGVCAGIANLLAALLRSQGVPVRKVNGYALENDELCWNETNMNRNECNHAWNEVFAEDRWILVDTTWDIDNEVHLYFDCTPEFFSYTHAYLLENK